jgi:toxin-antitoxin system PIN domain toxin
MTVLFDGNVLVAITFPTHVHHEAVHAWWTSVPATRFATCPITQGTLLRLALREGATFGQALNLLQAVCARPDHDFWPDDLSYASVRLSGVVGHRQVTDAYIAALARARGERLVTLDRGLAALHPDVADLVATG